MNTLEQRLESLRVGVGNMQCGLPGDEGHCTAAEVIGAALAELRRLRGEVERHRMTRDEKAAVSYFSFFHGSPRENDARSATILFGYLDRTKGVK